MNNSIQKSINQSVAFWTFRILSILVLGILFSILGFIFFNGFKVLSWEFISTMPSEGMTKGGILPAIIGTFCLIGGSMIFAFPIGLMSGIYISEFTKDSWYRRLIQLMTSNLAGIPSIVFGMFGMSLFVNKLEFGDSILAGSLTLGLLVLPIIIRTTEESLKAIDKSFSHASMALGASKIQTIRRVILPIGMPNILTGMILSIGRVSGETAPILFTVAAYFLPKLPSSIYDPVMALPYHLYVISTSGTNIKDSRDMAFGTAVILILIVLILNLIASLIRKYLGKKYKTN
jgi:phosphate transport system permease protein